MASPFGPITAPNRTPASITFNAVGQESFPAVDVAESTPETTIAGVIVLQQDAKITHVAASAATVTGAPTIQIVLGGGAAGSVGDADEVAPAGTIVFSAAKALSNALDAYAEAAVLYPAEMDVIYPQGTVLTLRTPTTGADSATGLSVSVGLVPYDLKPTPVLAPLTPQDF